jgi:hypothetical protein
MKRNKFKTEVIFRKDKNGDITAYFPYVIANYSGDVTCYTHIGQHSSADYLYCIQKEKPARKVKYCYLKKELTNLGYNLKVIKRREYGKYLKALMEAKK